MHTGALNQEIMNKHKKIRIWRYYFIDEIEYMMIEFKTTYSSHEGLEEKEIDDIMTNFEIPKKLVVLRKESR